MDNEDKKLNWIKFLQYVKFLRTFVKMYPHLHDIVQRFQQSLQNLYVSGLLLQHLLKLIDLKCE